jgi:hypothetical protein
MADVAAQIAYSAAIGRQSAPHGGVVSPHFLLRGQGNGRRRLRQRWGN